MYKYENLTDNDISNLLCRNEASIGLPINLKEFNESFKKNQPLRQVVSKDHIFIILFSDNKKSLNFYHSSPGTGTRKASILFTECLDIFKANAQAILIFSWCPESISFGIASKYTDKSYGARGRKSDKNFRVDRFGNITILSSIISETHFYINGKMNISPTAINTWKDTIKAVELLIEQGYIEDNFKYNVSITNSIISMIISGFEIYNKKRLIEIEGEGSKPNIMKWVKRLKKYDEPEEFHNLEGIIKKKLINLQDFDSCKKAYNQCYNIIFGNIFKSQEIERIKEYIECRHQIIHVYPSLSCLNMAKMPTVPPIISNKETAILIKETFDNFISILHIETLKLRP